MHNEGIPSNAFNGNAQLWLMPQKGKAGCSHCVTLNLIRKVLDFLQLGGSHVGMPSDGASGTAMSNIGLSPSQCPQPHLKNGSAYRQNRPTEDSNISRFQSHWLC